MNVYVGQSKMSLCTLTHTRIHTMRWTKIGMTKSNIIKTKHKIVEMFFSTFCHVNRKKYKRQAPQY